MIIQKYTNFGYALIADVYMVQKAAEIGRGRNAWGIKEIRKKVWKEAGVAKEHSAVSAWSDLLFGGDRSCVFAAVSDRDRFRYVHESNAAGWWLPAFA